MPKGKQPVTSPVTVPLTFRGLAWCDGCGTELAPGDRLSGLCAACLNPKPKRPIPRYGRRGDRRG